MTAYTLFIIGLSIYIVFGKSSLDLLTPFLPQKYTLSCKLNKVFRRTGATTTDKEEQKTYLPRISKTTTTKTGHTITLTLPDGMKPLDIFTVREELAYSLKAGEIEIAQNNQKITITTYSQPLPAYVKFTPPNHAKLQAKHMIPIMLGESVRGTEIVDLTELPHLLIGGETKGGKSTLLNLIINYLSHNDRVALKVIDFAGVEMAYLKNYGIPVADHQGAAISHINSLEYLWQERKKLFMSAGTINIEQYNRRNTSKQLKYNVLLIDELGIFRERPGSDKEEKKILQAAMASLCDLGSVGRKYGIHLILATQKPSAEIVPGLLKDNIPASIAFPIKTVYGSMSILGHGGAQHLPRIRGRCIYQYDGERQLQVSHIKNPEEHIGYIKKPEKSLIYDVLSDEITG